MEKKISHFFKILNKIFFLKLLKEQSLIYRNFIKKNLNALFLLPFLRRIYTRSYFLRHCSVESEKFELLGQTIMLSRFEVWKKQI